MDRKKIAIFSTGWSGEILYKYLVGVCDGLAAISADIYLFLSHAVYGPEEKQNIGEMNIYNLPHMEDFDAALFFANGLDYPELLDNLNQRCTKANIPVIYTGKEYEQYYFVGCDNYVGTLQLGEHLINDHQVKTVWFIAGSRDNMDSNIRLQAVQDVLSKHNLQLPEQDIFYSNWSPYEAYTYVISRLQNGDSLPDAIICANDTLAMVICAELRKNHYSVPEDVLVTGFDNELLAQIYDPSICSVDQRFDNIGKQCAKMLIDLFQGLQIERKQTIPCEFIPSESCGCCSAKDFNAMRRRIGRNKFEEKIYNSNFDIKLTSLERYILQAKTYPDLGEALQKLNTVPTEYEGRTFHVVLDPLFEKTIVDQQRPLRIKGYPERMDAIFSKDKMIMQTNKTIRSGDIIPFLAPMKENRFFIILPLHEDEYSYGYIVFGDDVDKLKEEPLLRKYVDRFNIIMSKFYQNMRLDALNRRLLQMTETDALTHVKNRTAFETRLEELQTAMNSDLKPAFGLILFDVNNLKKINDNLGHEAGDEYIINSCRLICKTFKKSAVYRIGGDEFVVVLQNEDYANREKLLFSMRAEMERLKTADLLVYEKISIASGLALYSPDTDHNISDIFNRADASMYENKAAMKSKQS